MAETQQAATVETAPAVRQLPEPVARRGITESQWLTLCNTLFPGAAVASVLLVWDYCASRGLDPMKKPCHIVPMSVKDARSGEWGWRDVVMPGIYEYRITAHRTGLYLGHSEPVYGPVIDFKGLPAFEWCAMTFYRLNPKANQRVEFPVRVYFREVVALKKDGTVNERWSRAYVQMHTKCTEAAGLREAFPEEIGGEPTAEEMHGQTISPQATDIPATVVTALDRIPEGMRDNMERAFATLELSPGQRLTKANEFLGGDGVDPEAGAQALLDWCLDEFAKRKTGMPRAKKGNEKKTSSAGPTIADIVVTVQPSGSEGAKAESDGRVAGPEAPSGTTGQVASPSPESAKPAEVVTPAADNEALF